MSTISAIGLVNLVEFYYVQEIFKIILKDCYCVNIIKQFKLKFKIKHGLR